MSQVSSLSSFMNFSHFYAKSFLGSLIFRSHQLVRPQLTALQRGQSSRAVQTVIRRSVFFPGANSGDNISFANGAVIPQNQFTTSVSPHPYNLSGANVSGNQTGTYGMSGNNYYHQPSGGGNGGSGSHHYNAHNGG